MTDNARNDASTKHLALKDLRRARSVIARQGQVLLDSEINAQSGLTLARIETETLDIIGQTGTVSGSSAFKITALGTQIEIGAGRIYVDGLLVENMPSGGAPTSLFADQPHPPAVLAPTSPGGLVGLKIVVRYVDPVEDEGLIEPALGDIATAGRTLNDWQVMHVPAAASPVPGCGDAFAPWSDMVAPSSGMLSAKVNPTDPATGPCSITPGGGYTRLENLLYRVEVHSGIVMKACADGPRYGLDGLKLKVSRSNASIMARIKKVSGTVLTLSPPALDPLAWFNIGSFAEIVTSHADVDTTRERPALLEVSDPTDTSIRLSSLSATLIPLDANQVPVGDWFVRLWDRDPITITASTSATASGWVDIGDGVFIRAHQGSFRAGDHWTFAARVTTGEIDWPRTVATTAIPSEPIPVLPHGPTVHYTRLATLLMTGTGITLGDCRPVFAPLTQSYELDFAGGDGQSITPPTGPGAAALTADLPAPLRVIVRIGHRPVAGAKVTFALVGAVGQLSGLGATGTLTGSTVTLISNSDGVASATWKLGANPAIAAQSVTATLNMPPLPGQLPPPPLTFNAQLDIAAKVAYQPGSCAGLLGARTVQEALDTLCNNMLKQHRLEFLLVLGIRLRKTKHMLDNNEAINPADLAEGFEVFFSEPIVTQAKGHEPIARLTVDMPFPQGLQTQREWAKRLKMQAVEKFPLFGTSPVHLSGKIYIKERVLTWMPEPLAKLFLQGATEHKFGLAAFEREPHIFEEPMIRAFITLRGDSLWGEGEFEKRRYLNGEMMRFETSNNLFSIFPKDPGDPDKLADMILRGVDPQRAADFNLWLYFNLEKRIKPVPFNPARGPQ
jgi:hypothetical protein